MLGFILKRTLWAAFTLCAFMLILFGLQQWDQKREVDEILLQELRYHTQNAQSSLENEYQSRLREYHLDLPVFYMSWIPRSRSREVLKIVNPRSRQWYEEWNSAGYQLEDLLELQSAVQQADNFCISVDVNRELLRYQEPPETLYNLVVACDPILPRPKKMNMYWLPRLRWNGVDNRLHRWMTQGHSTIRSRQDGIPVGKKILSAFKWTITWAGGGVVLSYLVSILLGFVLNSRFKGWRMIVFFVLRLTYSVPLFLLATLAVVFLTTSTYGMAFQLFPTAGIFEFVPDLGTWTQIAHNFHRLILPLLLVAVHGLPYLSELFGESLQEERQRPYVNALRSRGLSAQRIMYRHITPNALFSVITTLGSRIVAIFSGSVIIEVIFGIPGMGKLLYDAILYGDWPLIYADVLLIGVVTILSYLLVDILYRSFNPKLDWR